MRAVVPMRCSALRVAQQYRLASSSTQMRPLRNAAQPMTPQRANDELMTSIFLVPYEPNAPYWANPLTKSGRALLGSMWLRARLRAQRYLKCTR